MSEACTVEPLEQVMWQRFTERARRVVFFAQEEAARLGENYVGTEHLLLGLVRESDNVAARVLERLDIPLGRVRAEVERQVTRGHGNLGQDMQLTPRAKRVIDLAYEAARAFNNNYIGTEHLLLGLIEEGDGLASRVLVNQGADRKKVREAVAGMQEGESFAAVSEEAHPSRRSELNDLMHRMRVLRAELEETSARISDLAAREVIEGDNTPEAEKLRQGAALARLRRLVETETKLGATPGDPAVVTLDAVLTAKRACRGLADLLAVADLTAEQAEALLLLAQVLKTTQRAEWSGQPVLLHRKSVALVFEKPSLRTRVTSEAGVFQMGAQPIYLGPQDIRMGERESVPDIARNLERWVHAIIARVFSHETVVQLAEHAKVPVINALSDHEHPCQALADMLTLQEHFGPPKGRHVAYIGDGNNVAHSLVLLAAKLGVNVTLACPEGYEPAEGVLEAARADAAQSEARIAVVRDPLAAAAGADALYTDVWTSMGQEDEAEERRRIFRDYQINDGLLAAASPEAIILHCLPAHRGEEITAEAIDGPRSAVFDQAENRLHAQKAVLAALV